MESDEAARVLCADRRQEVELGINKVRELIRKNQLYVLNTCKNALDEFNPYRYDPEKKKEEPLKENYHVMDALRHAIYNHTATTFTMPMPTTGLVKSYPGMVA